MLDQRRRRWAGVVQMLDKCFVFDGMLLQSNKYEMWTQCWGNSEPPSPAVDQQISIIGSACRIYCKKHFPFIHLFHICYCHIIYQLLNLTSSSKIWPPFCQIWIIFTPLKLLIAVDLVIFACSIFRKFLNLGLFTKFRIHEFSFFL